ncbi:MAG: hypothetical protein KDE51_23410, partial [Anaerolineales bacterium]|nr:hypothetical protein [Anaerolineales bacterium]
MLADLGFTAILLAFLITLVSMACNLYGGIKRDVRFIASGRNAILAIFPLLLIACAIIVVALLTDDYSIEYV